MNYEDVKAKVFVHGTTPDGYFGKRAPVGFALVGHTIVTVAECGLFKTGLPDCIDESKALWLLNHHPTAKHMKLLS